MPKSQSLDLFDRPSNADTGGRQDFDRYETPGWMTASLLEHQPIDRALTILEPCCGDGAIVRALAASGFKTIITNDLDPRHEASRHRDAADPAFWELETFSRVDWVITNPPFNVALQIVEQAVILARIGVAMLLRKTFLEPTGTERHPKPEDRGPWLSIHPPSRMIGLPRHSFRGKGSDSVSTDWYIWLRKPDGSLQPFIIDYRAKDRRIA